MDNAKNNSGKLSREQAINMLYCLGLALFWVVFIWNFWQKGIYALGLNAFIFFSGALLLFIGAGFRKKHYAKKDLTWIIPLFLIALSYLIYDNPFIKATGLLVMLFFSAVFINYGYLADKAKRFWDFNFVLQILGRILSFLGKIRPAADNYISLLVPRSGNRGRAIAKTILGLILFLVIAVTIIIPLLSSADSLFAAKIDFIYDFLKDIISTTFVYRLVVFLILAILLLSTFLAWTKRLDVRQSEDADKKIDPIVSGIVLGGILALYLLFLWVQLERLWISGLPFDFKSTETLVKSGFWQLFFLSVINVFIYFFTYRKTNKTVQNILTAFTAASFLLLISAGHRMGLYAVYYGFSYEKFFASYTVLYSAILFVFLLYSLFRAKRADVLKFVVFLFLWMFAFAAILPVERIILGANIALSKRPDSRIRLFELTMLSPDVLSAVVKYESAGLLKESAGYLVREGEGKTEEQFDWSPWIKRQQKLIADKRWYEKNLMNLFNN